MSRRMFAWLGALMVVVGVAVRVNNALYYPLMRGYDAFAHFTYVWFLAEYGRVPMATAGWEFFQPPGYYATVYAFWSWLGNTDAMVRLRVANVAIALLGTTQAYVAWQILRGSFPGQRIVQLLGVGLMLFIPVHLYSSGFFGNEGLTAVACSLALLALYRTLEKETPLRAAALGLALGVAMLTKFTGLVVVATAFATLGLRSLVRRDFAGGAKTLSIVATVALVICGWFYVRNVVVYGNPFQMSREELFLSHIENAQPQGQRSILEYVLFDFGILYRPQWPRGLPLSGGRPAHVEYSAMRESIPTGMYANAWFDGFGGFALPSVTRSEITRRAGQALMTLGMIPTLLMLVGFLASIRRVIRNGWDDVVVTMLFATAAMAAVIIKGTSSVPTHAAVKATYLMPIAVAFAYWFAAGVSAVSASRAYLLRPIAGACALLAAISVGTFSHGLVIDNEWMSKGGGGPAFRNLDGMIYYAAGQHEKALARFQWAAEGNSLLAVENLAEFALANDRPLEALYRLRQIARLKERHLSRAADSQRPYIEATLAEHLNSIAVILLELDWDEQVEPWLVQSQELDPGIPESHFNFGILRLKRALASQDPEVQQALLQGASEDFERCLHLDANFFEALAMRGVARILAGDCTNGGQDIRDATAEHPGKHRFYPLKTGPGDLIGAGLHRRRRVRTLPEDLRPSFVLEMCSGHDA